LLEREEVIKSVTAANRCTCPRGTRIEDAVQTSPSGKWPPFRACLLDRRLTFRARAA
jgi:hypothetical protein